MRNTTLLVGFMFCVGSLCATSVFRPYAKGEAVPKCTCQSTETTGRDRQRRSLFSDFSEYLAKIASRYQEFLEPRVTAVRSHPINVNRIDRNIREESNIMHKEVSGDGTGDAGEDKVESATGDASEDKVESATGDAGEDKVGSATGDAGEDKVESATGDAGEDKVGSATGDADEDKVESATGDADEDKVESATGDLSEDEAESEVKVSSEEHRKSAETSLEAQYYKMERERAERTRKQEIPTTVPTDNEPKHVTHKFDVGKPPTDTFRIESKTFYITVEPDARGTMYIRVAEVWVSGRQSHILLTPGTLLELRDQLLIFNDFAERGQLASDNIMTRNFNYYLDLKENNHGQYLRVGQTTARGKARSQIAIPARWITKFEDRVTSFLRVLKIYDATLGLP